MEDRWVIFGVNRSLSERTSDEGSDGVWEVGRRLLLPSINRFDYFF